MEGRAVGHNIERGPPKDHPRVQFTMGFKIPYDTGVDLHPWYIEPPY